MAATVDIRIRADTRDAARAFGVLTDKSKAYANQALAAETRIGTAHEKNRKAILDNTKAIGKETEAYRELEKAAKDTDVAKAKFGREQLGSISTSLGSVASVTGAFGTGAGTEALRFGGDVAGALEHVGEFKQSILDAGEAAAKSGGLFSTIASAAQAAVPALGAAGAGLLAIGAVVAPLAALALAFTALSSALEQTRQAAEATAAAERERARELFDFNQLLEKGDYSGATARLKELETEIGAKNAERERLVKLRDAAQADYDARARNDDLGRLFDRQRIDVFAGQIETLDKEIQDTTVTLFDMSGVLGGVEGQAAKTAEALQKQIAIDVDVAKKRLAEESKLNAEIARSIATIAQLEQQQKDLNQSYREANAAVAERRRIEDERRKEDESLATKRAAEDLARQLERQETEHKKNLLAIQQRGNDQILAARADLAKKEADTVKQIADLQAQFRKEQAQAEKEFLKQRRRDAQDFRREQKRAQQDFERSQLEALIENDIGSIIVNEMNRDIERQRDRQDFRRERRRGRTDFEEERAAAQAALQERIAGIQKELEEYRIATEQKIAQIQLQTETELALAQAAYEERLVLDAEERRIQNERDAEDARIERDRRIQDRNAEDAARLVSHIVALDQIREKAALEQGVADGLKQKLLEVQALLKQTSAFVLNQARGGGYTGAGGSQVADDTPGYADGALVMRPFKGRVKLGEREPEGIIPLRQLPRIASQMGIGGGNTEVHVHIGAVGEIVTPSQLADVQRVTIEGVQKGIMQARTQRIG